MIVATEQTEKTLVALVCIYPLFVNGCDAR